MKVFLGGTCNGSTWRNELIPLLKIDYFNPVVKDWTPDCAEEEIRQRAECDFCLYVLTPEMTGFLSIAEVVEDSIKRPSKTVLCVLAEYGGEEFKIHQKKSLDAIIRMVEANGAKHCKNLAEVAEFLNHARVVHGQKGYGKNILVGGYVTVHGDFNIGDR